MRRVKLNERDLTRIVKRVINETELHTGKLDNLVEHLISLLNRTKEAAKRGDIELAKKGVEKIIKDANKLESVVDGMHNDSDNDH